MKGLPNIIFQRFWYIYIVVLILEVLGCNIQKVWWLIAIFLFEGCLLFIFLVKKTYVKRIPKTWEMKIYPSSHHHGSVENPPQVKGNFRICRFSTHFPSWTMLISTEPWLWELRVYQKKTPKSLRPQKVSICSMINKAFQGSNKRFPLAVTKSPNGPFRAPMPRP